MRKSDAEGTMQKEEIAAKMDKVILNAKIALEMLSLAKAIAEAKEQERLNKSASQWLKQGRRVLPKAVPVGMRYSGGMYRKSMVIFNIDSTVPIRRKAPL
jgi:hypothetical protein